MCIEYLLHIRHYSRYLGFVSQQNRSKSTSSGRLHSTAERDNEHGTRRAGRQEHRGESAHGAEGVAYVGLARVDVLEKVGTCIPGAGPLEHLRKRCPTWRAGEDSRLAAGPHFPDRQESWGYLPTSRLNEQDSDHQGCEHRAAGLLRSF